MKGVLSVWAYIANQINIFTIYDPTFKQFECIDG